MKNPPSFQFYPKIFLCDIHVQAMNHEERGKLFKDICHAAENGDIEFLKQFRFIGKIRRPSGNNRKHIPAWIKKMILSLGRCLFCGNTNNLSVDHVVPIAKGGTDDPSNFQCLCRKCNSKKGARI
jgi:5-methylcytosine-specific restriction endonuclease McrA